MIDVIGSTPNATPSDISRELDGDFRDCHDKFE